ncbi:hypothetical protein GDO81_003877 [Engystomops pustulosus]|uniref:NADH dehydrogenase subunit 3 n=1 Tax=Engystomops pustulosus TaxID=76066 RepID=A0AAV7A5K4_ENGPU|nr:hypothetical protein GDO81_003877 [Engystomops pustulosus]
MAAPALSLVSLALDLSVCLFCIISYESEQIPALNLPVVCVLYIIYIYSYYKYCVYFFESWSFTAIYLSLETQHALFWGILGY